MSVDYLQSLVGRWLMTAALIIIPVYAGCIIALIPLRLADPGTFFARKLFWKLYLSVLSALAVSLTLATWDMTGDRPATRMPFAAELPLFAVLFALAGYGIARWLIWYARLQPHRFEDVF